MSYIAYMYANEKQVSLYKDDFLAFADAVGIGADLPEHYGNIKGAVLKERCQGWLQANKGQKHTYLYACVVNVLGVAGAAARAAVYVSFSVKSFCVGWDF